MPIKLNWKIVVFVVVGALLVALEAFKVSTLFAVVVAYAYFFTGLIVMSGDEKTRLEAEYRLALAKTRR